jgi:serine/threonine protein kinase
MADNLASQLEPIPGYTLIEPLGQGGFGEVWKAQAPGGIPKAIKFVKGSLYDLDGKMPAAQELKALNRVKDVHHPFILSLERVDVVDGQLIIVMELADRNLQNRLQECQLQGLPGIPRAELLRYLTEAAEALDLMNGEYQLQHLDIKPANLFLVHNHCKVADFGLVKDLEGMTAAVTSGITPVYAAPETFEGTVSRFSDQYSLAIVYQELLTGKRPYDGKNARQLLMQHVKGTPDLSPLPPRDREIIGRALAKIPSERFASCGELIRALRKAPTVAVALPPAPPPSAGSADLQKTPAYRPASAKPPAAAGQSNRAKPRNVDLPASSGKSNPPGNRITSPDFDFYATTGPKSGDPAAKSKTSDKSDTVEIAKNDTHHDKVAKSNVEDVPCPRCGALLLDPGKHAWCGSCGYCGDLEDSAKRLDRIAAARPGLMWPKRLSWGWIMLGAFGIMALSIAVVEVLSILWPSQESLAATIVIMGLGIMLILATLIFIIPPVKKRKKTHLRKPLPPP